VILIVSGFYDNFAKPAKWYVTPKLD